MPRDIGIDVTPPEKECTDQNCPFHGKLSVRGQILEGQHLPRAVRQHEHPVEQLHVLARTDIGDAHLDGARWCLVVSTRQIALPGVLQLDDPQGGVLHLDKAARLGPLQQDPHVLFTLPRL